MHGGGRVWTLHGRGRTASPTLCIGISCTFRMSLMIHNEAELVNEFQKISVHYCMNCCIKKENFQFTKFCVYEKCSHCCHARCKNLLLITFQYISLRAWLAAVMHLTIFRNQMNFNTNMDVPVCMYPYHLQNIQWRVEGAVERVCKWTNTISLYKKKNIKGKGVKNALEFLTTSREWLDDT